MSPNLVWPLVRKSHCSSNGWFMGGRQNSTNLRTERSTGQNSKWIVSWGFMMISSFLDVLQGTNLNWNPPYSWMQTVKASCRFSISQSIDTVSLKIAGCVSHLPQLQSETFSDAAWSHGKIPWPEKLTGAAISARPCMVDVGTNPSHGQVI